MKDIRVFKRRILQLILLSVSIKMIRIDMKKNLPKIRLLTLLIHKTDLDFLFISEIFMTARKNMSTD